MTSLDSKAPTLHVPAIILAVSVLILFAIGLNAYKNGRADSEAELQRRVSSEIAATSGELLDALRDAETGQRGYLLTGKPDYLAPYNQAVARLPQLTSRLRAEVASRPDQAARLRDLGPLIDAKLQELAETIELRQTKGFDAALEVVDANHGNTIMDQLRQKLGVVGVTETRRLNEFIAQSELSSRYLREVSTAGSIALFGFLLAFVVSIARLNIRREKAVQLLQTTLSSIADGVVVTDAEARIVFLNAAALHLCGWDAKDTKGRAATEVLILVNETTRETVSNPLEEALRKGSAVGLANHTVLIKKDGTEITIDDSAAPIRLGQKIVGGVLVFRDVSQKRRDDRELLELTGKLRRSNEELEHFAHAAAHDLRSPLNSVQNMSQILARRYSDGLGDEGRELLGYITAGIRRMSILIRDLLAFSQAGNVDSDPSPVSLEKALQAAVDNLDDDITRESALITFDRLPVVMGHEPSFTQLFQNLIGNSLKYRSEERPRVHISASRQGSECVVTLRDNGVGFEPIYAQEIFKPFKRLHGQELEGSGMGLATCQKVIERYGGRIWARSEVGKGAEFSFALAVPEWKKVAGQS